MTRTAILLPVALLMIVAAAAAGADEGKNRTAFEQKVIRLAHTDARETAELLQGFLNEGRVASEGRSNAIVISGPPGEIEMALKLVAELDVPDAEQSGESSAIIRIGDAAPPDLMDLIHTLISGRTSAALDRKTGMLVLRGPTTDITEVRKLIESLPQAGVESPAKPLAISFYFVQGRTGSANQTRTEVPAARPLRPTPDPRDEQARAKLEQAVEVNFEGVPLEEVLHRLSQTASVDMVVDWVDLENFGIAPDRAVTLQLRSNVPLRQALKLVLDKAADGHGVTYAVREGLVHVALRDKLDYDRYVDAYVVRDLLSPEWAISELGDTPPPGTAISPPRSAGPASDDDSQRGGTPAASDAAIQPPYAAQRNDEASQRLIQLIVNTIRPHEWVDNGGNLATINESNGMLVVNHNAPGHQAVADLLALLRTRQAETRAAARRMEMPAALQTVVASLGDSGFHDATLLAPLKIMVGNDGVFELEGIASQFDRILDVKVAGQARTRPDGSIELQVHAELRPKATGAHSDDEPLFRLNCTLITPLGEYLALATSPGATDDDQAVALVVRVDATP